MGIVMGSLRLLFLNIRCEGNMAYIISIVYSVLLGSVASNFVHVERVVPGPPMDIKVYSLLHSKNAFRVVLILLLFLVDWVCFMTIFPPSEGFSMKMYDVGLLVIYLPGLGVLSLATIMALSNNNGYYNYVNLYFLFTLIGEIIWVFLSLYSDDFTVSAKQIAFFFLIVAIYILIKIFIIFAFKGASDKKGSIHVYILMILGIILKPSAIILISSTTNVKMILGLL